MTMFMSTISGKIDAKGRVSVPSVFRSAISAQNGAAQSGASQGIFVYPSFTENAIEGGGHTLMNDIGAMVERLNLFAEERDALAASLFADSHHLNFDADGRVSLPAALLAHALASSGWRRAALGVAAVAAVIAVSAAVTGLCDEA